MRRILAIVSAAAMALIMMAPSAMAGTSLDEAAAALKHSRVYVAPDAEGTTTDTAGILTAQLTQNDNIALVMLPASALATPGTTPASIARQLDQATNHQFTLAVAIGDDKSQTAAVSTLLTAGAASEQMNIARTISVNSVETMLAFVRTVHSWQAQHPEQVHQPPKPNPPAAPKAKEEPDRPFWLYALLLVCLIGFVTSAIRIVMPRRNKDDDSSTPRVKLSGPRRIRDELDTIMSRRSEITDRGLREVITQMVRDTNEVFRILERDAPGRVEVTSIEFEQHLQALIRVIDKYIDIQKPERRRYYVNPDQDLRDGREAIEGYAEYVLNSARRAGRADLTEYTVDTKILSAQKYA